MMNRAEATSLRGKEALDRGRLAAVSANQENRVVNTKPHPLVSLPLELHWNDAGNPLPRRAVHAPVGAKPQTIGLEMPPHLHSGPIDQPFDFCRLIRALCCDIVRHCAELKHIDISRLLFGVTQTRSVRLKGLQARLTPMRCRGGRLTRRCRDGRLYQVQRYFVNGREMLYVMTFYLPRFLDENFDEKFITLFHELYHISPLFDGDLRRHDGHCDVHSRSKHLYDVHMAHLARTYLSNGADRSLHGFLRLNFAQLRHRHGSVIGIVVPRPRLLPIPPHPQPLSPEAEERGG